MPNRGLAIAVLALLAQAGCTDATGSVSGGQPLIAQQSGGAPTWTALYADLFGPSGRASCSALGSCHVSCTSGAGQLGGFTCTSKDSCWQGMTGMAIDAGVTDAGDSGDAGAPTIAGYCYTFTAIEGSDPTTTRFYSSLHQASSSSDNKFCNTGNVINACNMPCGDPDPDGGSEGCHQQRAAYTFTPDDLARIATWLQQGAQYN